VLAAPRSSGGSLSGATVPLAILDALLLALAAGDRGRSLTTLAELNELRKRLRGGPVPASGEQAREVTRRAVLVSARVVEAVTESRGARPGSR
jgi:hypothetical protein